MQQQQNACNAGHADNGWDAPVGLCGGTTCHLVGKPVKPVMMRALKASTTAEFLHPGAAARRQSMHFSGGCPWAQQDSAISFSGAPIGYVSTVVRSCVILRDTTKN